MYLRYLSNPKTTLQCNSLQQHTFLCLKYYGTFIQLEIKEIINLLDVTTRYVVGVLEKLYHHYQV